VGGPVVAVRDVAGKARARLERETGKARARLERERERRYLVALTFLIADHGRRTAASVLAGALAFRLFLTLLPLSLVLVVALGYAKSAGGTPSAALEQFGIKGAVASTINHSASFSNPGRTAVLLLGLWGVFQGARTTVAALRAIHALAWGMPVIRWRHKAPAAIVFLGAMVVVTAAAGVATSVRADAGVALGFGASFGIAIVYGGMWLGASMLLPHRDGVAWTAFIPGAVLVGAGFAVLQVVTANWIGPKLDRESALYGSLGVSFVVLGWLYVVARLTVAAPLLNAAVLQQREIHAGGAHPGSGASEAGDASAGAAGVGESATGAAGASEAAGGSATARSRP
jgi:uncharacterized BrkB/YihY/UPF0761 family membrane protein